MKSMNKKGFTLAELLSVIVIIALLTSIAVISYTAIINSTQTKVFESYRDTMHDEAVMYFIKNSSLAYKLNQDGSNSKILSLSDLEIEEINNPINKNDKCLASNVVVTRNNTTGMISLKYHVCLVCNDYSECKDYID